MATNPSLPLDQVLLGDCINLMQQLPAESFDFALTDPPYLCMYKSRDGRTVHNDSGAGEWLQPAFEQVYRLLRQNSVLVSFYGWTRVDDFVRAWRSVGFRLAGHLTFPKRYTSSSGLVRYQHESAFVLAKGSPRPPTNLIGDVIDWGTYTGNSLHPTMKPLSVLTPLIESFCPYGGSILDPFAGSASTLIAARLAGRHALGMEIDPKIHEVAQARLARMRNLVLRSFADGEEAREFAMAA